LSTLYIAVARNPDNNYTLLHKPIVALGGGSIQQCECRTYELFDSLKSAGASDEEINPAKREIKEKGQTIFESTEITDAGLQSVVSKCCAPPGS
jgi:hypothetical protein